MSSHSFSDPVECADDDTRVTAVIALIQFCAGNNKEKNWLTCERLIRQAVAENSEVQLVCLPENFSFMGTNRYESLAAAEPLFLSQTLAKYQALAHELGLWISLGGFQEACHENNKMIFNTHVVIPPTGELKEEYCYRKSHLCDLPKLGLSESTFTIPGNRLVIVNMGFAKVGLACCFDYRFPLLFREYAARGADLVLVPAACTVPTGMVHWECLLRARAIENQIFIAAAAQTGVHNEHRESYGRSLAINAWGDIVGSCEKEDEYVVLATYDRAFQEGVRSRMNVQDTFDYSL